MNPIFHLLIMGYGHDMTRFGDAKGIPVLDGYRALNSVLGHTCRPMIGGSLSLNHPIPALGVRSIEKHTALEDAIDTAKVLKALCATDALQCAISTPMS